MTKADIAVAVRGLSKSYTIAHNAQKHTTLGEALAHRLKNPLQRAEKETFWALKDVSFDIRKGDVVGIIGRNGAGKSTLLKILSRITKPTSGEVRLYGRVGSLLEVGTGFHPELTGRENIYLNGAILGMRKREIDRHFDAIVDFAEVEQFLDTPVKRYSSGMYVRLAFAVAAHLNPEILVVDEVLAVGDAEFQKKCLGKMKDVATSGRTVLFVSHNMDAIRLMCRDCISLQAGRVVRKGSPELLIEGYLRGCMPARDSQWHASPDGTRDLVIEAVSCQLGGKQPSLTLAVRVKLGSRRTHKSALIAVDVLNGAGTAIMQALPSLLGFIGWEKRTHDVSVHISLPPLIPGTYSVTVWVGSHNSETLDIAPACVAFEVDASPTVGRTFPHTADHGYIVPLSRVDCDSLVAVHDVVGIGATT